MSQLLLLIAVLAFTAIAVGASVFFMQRFLNPEPSVVQQRLLRMQEDDKPDDDILDAEIQKKLEKLYRVSDYKYEGLGKKLEEIKMFKNLKKLIRQSGETEQVDKVFLKFFVAPVVVALFIALVLKNVFLILLSMLVPFIVRFVFIFKKKQRFNKFIALFPEALNLMTSSLRAGHSFQASLTIISTEMNEPVKTEFEHVVSDINLGISVKEALLRFGDNLDNMPDIRMYTTAVLIQRESGGNLAEILTKLSYTIRERFKIKGQISAMTGQSRLTGYVIGAMPTALLVGLMMFMPDYVAPLFEDPLGRGMLIVAAILQIIGVFVIRKIVDIRI